MLHCLVIYCDNHVNFDIEWKYMVIIQVTGIWEVVQLALLLVFVICIFVLVSINGSFINNGLIQLETARISTGTIQLVLVANLYMIL